MAGQALPDHLPDAAQVPKDLQGWRQWVGWRYQRRGRRWTKVPVNPHSGDFADPTDSATWGTLEHALAAARELHLDGIGFVLSATDPFVGIDLDDCVQPTTRTLAPWAREIVEELDSYAEISPSGTGLRIFVMAQLPGDRRRRGKVEMYDAKRFLTFTGDALPDTPLSVKDRCDETVALYDEVFRSGDEPATITLHEPPRCVPSMPGKLGDEELIAKAAESQNGSKFTSLFVDGNIEGYSSQSEADMALCSLIAFFTGPDEAQIDRVFRRSALYRPKWERADYRASTIARVLNRTEFYSPAADDGVHLRLVPPPDRRQGDHPWIIDVFDLLAEPDEPDIWQIEGLVRHPTVSIVVGPAKTYKSFLVQEAAIAVATGTRMFGVYAVPEPRRVVYIQDESSRRAVRSRFRSILDGRGMQPESVRGALFTITNQGFQLDDPETVSRLIDEAIEAHEPELIILDPFAEIHSGDENDAREIRPILRSLKDIRDRYNVSVIVVHHNNKNPEYKNPADSIRGSTAIWASMDGGIFLASTKDEKQKKVSVVLKEGGQADPFFYVVEDGQRGIEFSVHPADDAKQTLSDHDIVSCVERLGWSGIAEISEALQISERRLRPRLNALAAQGLIGRREVITNTKKYEYGPRDEALGHALR